MIIVIVITLVMIIVVIITLVMIIVVIYITYFDNELSNYSSIGILIYYWSLFKIVNK